MNYKNYADLSVDILQGIGKVPCDIQLVVGIPRSGMVPAYIIGAQLNLPVVTLNDFIIGKYGEIGERQIGVDRQDIKNALIVDDSIYSGKAMSMAKAKLEEIKTSIKLHFCAIYASEQENKLIDFYFKLLPQPRVFQWNYKNHYIATESCYDIDGVLCVDPTEEQNDDGQHYKDFLINAKPLFIPQYKISCIVTSRLEKYRNETMGWLAKHKIIYDDLIMLDLESAEKRRKLGIHGKFKATVFEKRKEKYFIESNWGQAQEIFRLTQKPVFCTQNDKFLRSNLDLEEQNRKIKNSRFYKLRLLIIKIRKIVSLK